MARLDGSGGTVDLAPGYRLAAPGLVGTATAREPRPTDGAWARGPELATTAFDQAMAATGLREVMNVDLTVQAVPPPPGAPTVRTVSGQDGLVLETPDLGDEVGQVVLAVDEAGVVTWNFPETSDHEIEPPMVRGAAGVKRFVIRRTTPPPPSEDEAVTRGLFGALGRKILKVLVYPVADAVLGPVTEHFAGAWEAHHRPYRTRPFSPADFRRGDVDALTPDDWRRLADGPSLLFVHGTFSTSHGGFAGMPDATLAELHRRYDGRVFAFDHFTLSHTPEENVAELAARMPDDVALDVDVVSHSRGGLVTRVLAGELPGAGAPGLAVRRAVFVATPNHGTALADADHMVAFIDRYTSVLNLMPPGPLGVVSEILEAVVTVVKVVGHAFLRGLPGLTAMDPAGDFIRRINAGPAPGAAYYALAAEYEPTGPLRSLVLGTVADQVVDRVFGDQANDLVVPTRGVFEGGGDPAFPIGAARLLTYPGARGVQHTSFFHQDDTTAKLLEWLGA